MSQKSKYVINSILWTLISTAITGTVLQTFLLEKGITEEKVGHFVSIMQFVQMGVILLFSLFADKIKNVIRVTAMSNTLYLPFLVVMSVMCFTKTSGYIPLLLCGIIAYIATGIYNVLSYKIPYHIMDMRHYGKWTGAAGGFAAVFMLVLTSLLSLVQDKFGYFTSMKYFFPLCAVCTAAFVTLTAAYKKIEAPAVQPAEEKITLLKYKPFTLLIIPNLLRGFCAGVIAMAVTIGYASGQLNSSYASILLVITNTVSIPANFLYTRLTGKEPSLILICSIIILGSVGVTGFAGSVGFLVCYGIAYFCLMIINVSVPVLVTKFVDYRIVGQYNGWRMLLNSAGIFIASLVCVPVINRVGTVTIWVLAGLSQLISALAYYFYCKKTGLKIQYVK